MGNNKIVKSKESKAKIRRWSLLLELTKDGQSQQHTLPAIVIGNHTDAVQACLDVYKDINSNPIYEGVTVTVKPEANETVSHVVARQLQEADRLSDLLSISLKNACIDLLRAKYISEAVEFDEESEKFATEVKALVGEYVMAEYKHREDVIKQQFAQMTDEELMQSGVAVIDSPEGNSFGIIPEIGEVQLLETENEVS